MSWDDMSDFSKELCKGISNYKDIESIQTAYTYKLGKTLFSVSWKPLTNGTYKVQVSQIKDKSTPRFYYLLTRLKPNNNISQAVIEGGIFGDENASEMMFELGLTLKENQVLKPN
jgi:hypothetical protein